jgi:hypothetical protein
MALHFLPSTFHLLPSTFYLLPALACPVCYTAADPAITDSLNAGILVLLGATGLVLAAVGGFIVTLVRRARRMPHVEERTV